MIDAKGVAFATYEIDGDPHRRRPPVFLVHGWPEIAHCWKNQIGAVAGAGFRVIAFDLKGFGRSDAPPEVEAYRAARIADEFAALADALDIAEAVWCGHDWGGSLVWAMAQWRPDRVAGVASVCLPLKPRAPAPPTAIFKKRFGAKHYIVRFNEEPGVEDHFATDTERFVKLMFRRPARRERWPDLIPWVFDIEGRFHEASRDVPPGKLVFDQSTVDIYAAAYNRSGFRGGANLYRSIDRNWADMEGRDETVRAPALWVGADMDMFLPPESAGGMDGLVPNLETAIIPDCGHWVTWEKPDALNRILTDWMMRKFN